MGMQEEISGSHEPEGNVVPRRIRRGVVRDPMFWLGLVVFIGLCVFCFAGPMFDRLNGMAIHLSSIAQPPSTHWLLGTDGLGRSELVRVMLGGRLILLIGMASALAASVLGLGVGLAAGYWGGAVDRSATWVIDVVLSVPQLVPLLIIENMLTTSAWTMMFTVAATTWPLVARPIRSEALSLRQRDYVDAARSLGAGDVRIMLRHVLPGLWSTLLTTASTSVGTAVLLVATASFLGFSLPPPWPDWGSMIAQGLDTIYNGYWWLMVFPGAALVMMQLSLNFISDAARDTLARATGVGS